MVSAYYGVVKHTYFSAMNTHTVSRKQQPLLLCRMKGGIVRPCRSIGARGHWKMDCKDMIYFQQRLAREHPGAGLGGGRQGCARSPARQAVSIPSQRSGGNGLHAYGVRGYVDLYAATHEERRSLHTGVHWQAPPITLTGQVPTSGLLDTSWHETQVDPGDVPHTLLLDCMEQVRVHACGCAYARPCLSGGRKCVQAPIPAPSSQGWRRPECTSSRRRRSLRCPLLHSCFSLNISAGCGGPGAAGGGDRHHARGDPAHKRHRYVEHFKQPNPRENHV
jgi:hypothetical protein